MNKNKVFQILSILSFSIVLINCGRSVKFKSTISAVKTAPFEDLRISSTVGEFKSAGFNYGDLVEYYYFDEKHVKHHHTVPFVSNYLVAGLNQGCICDYEKAGKAISICLGFTDDYDEMTMDAGVQPLIGNEIVFTLYRANGWSEVNNKLSIGAKNTYESVGRNKYVYVNMRDIKRVGDNIFNIGIANNTIYRTSSPFDDVYNNKRYQVVDNCISDIAGSSIEHENKIILVSLNYNDDRINEFYQKRKMDSTAPLFCYLKERDNVIGVNVGDNFFSSINRDRIKTLFIKLVKKIEALNTDGYTIIFSDTEGSVRTGFVIFMLEALLRGSSEVDLKTLVSDYMLSFANYYNIVNDTDPSSKGQLIKDFTINRILYTLSSRDSVLHQDYEGVKNIDWFTFKTADFLKVLNVEKYIHNWVELYFTGFLDLKDVYINNLRKIFLGQKMDPTPAD